MAKPYRPSRWQPALVDAAACWLLSSELGISPVTAQVLYNRGFDTPEAAHGFLTAGREQILDPFRLKDMDKAVALIRQCIAAGRPIMVYGDYDVDGVTGTAVLVLALRALGAQVDYYIPDRFSEGYGLHTEALAEIRRRGYDFILCVDTGVSAVAEAEAARAMGITLVVTDHHEPGPVLPRADALINPKRPDCSYPFKGLSGVGVAFKLAMALGVPDVWDLLDIVTLGTIADMVPLVGENRAIVREGLERLGNTRRPGLRALMDLAGVRQPVTATHVGFALGPRINALGRMGSAMAGVELLLTDDPDRGWKLARELDEANRRRQEVEMAILQEALQQAETLPPEEKQYVLVLAGEGWHHGVVGICASRVLEVYHRPTILLSVDGEEVRGSARSIPGFHMYRALSKVADLFTKFGGHAAAAGMTLRRKEDLPELRRRLNQLAARWLRPEDLEPRLQIDAFLSLDQLTDRLMAELQQLEPHGVGNPAPVFAVRDLAVVSARTLGQDARHLKLIVQQPGLPVAMEAVGWGMAELRPSPHDHVQVAFQPEYNTWQGQTRLRLTLKDLRTLEAPGSAGPTGPVLTPLVTEEACLKWDPLAVPGGPWRRPAEVRDVRGRGLEEVEALVTEDDRRILLLTASPWAAAGLVESLRRDLPEYREEIRLWNPGEPEPAEGRLVVAPYGVDPRGPYTDTVLYHPPYRLQQVQGRRIHLLWTESDWVLAEASLGWPYPDREVLVVLYKLLKRGEADPDRLATALREVPGPWNRLRLAAGEAIFRELGLLDGHRLCDAPGVRFSLEASPRYRRGMEGRTHLRQLRRNDWPDCLDAL
ncbi:MAG TPA: single-stranded-DNA-specific exonuclease RecJ [Symbiobacteriaceae bacterium]